MKSYLFLISLFAVLCVPNGYAQEPPVVHYQSDAEIPKLSKSIQKMIDKKAIAGAIVMVSWKGKIIHYHAEGMRDIKEKSSLQKDSVVRIYSMTKPVTSVAVMMLHERGLLQLDDPIEKYLPEFQDVGVHHKRRVLPLKRSITIRDLMRHTAGFSYGFFSNTAVDKMYMKNHPLYSRNNREMTKKLSAYPLLSQPGKKWHYSVATDVLGDLVERVSGMSLGEFFAQNITKPLSMNDTSFSVSSDRIDRFSSVYGPKQKPKEYYKKSHYLQSNRIQSGGGGLVSTAQDYMRFCEMLVHGGELDGVRLLTQKSVAEMTKNQLPEGVFTYGVFGFGLGFQVQLYDWGNKGHIGEYGWDGAASTHFWISPSDELIVVALSQRQPYSSQLKEKIKPIIYRHIKNR